MEKDTTIEPKIVQLPAIKIAQFKYNNRSYPKIGSACSKSFQTEQLIILTLITLKTPKVYDSRSRQPVGDLDLRVEVNSLGVCGVFVIRN
jgi:hypothetical protein